MGRYQEAITFSAEALDADDDIVLQAQYLYLHTVLGRAPARSSPDLFSGFSAGQGTTREMGLLVNLGQTASATGRFDRTVLVADELLSIADRGMTSASPGHRADALEASSLLFVKAGCVRRARDYLQRAALVDGPDREERCRASRFLAMARCQYLSGDWDGALDTVSTGSVLCEGSQQLSALRGLRLVEIRIILERGKLLRAEGLLTELASECEGFALFRATCSCCEAQIAYYLGNLDQALYQLEQVRAESRDHDFVEPYFTSLDLLAQVSLSSSDRVRAENASSELLALAERTSLPIVRNLANITSGEVSGDMESLVRALQRADVDGTDYFKCRAALTLAEYGVKTGYHTSVAARLNNSIRADRWTTRIRYLAREDQSDPAPNQHRTSEISPLDRRLISLVGEGLSNREIAQELHYSTKTIEVYLSRLYRKVGCRSRTDLLRVMQESRTKTRDTTNHVAS